MLAEELGQQATTADVGLSDVIISAGAPPDMGGADLGGGAVSSFGRTVDGAQQLG